MAYQRKSARRGRASGATQSLARGLGWLSIVTGAAELLAPQALARMFGLRGQETLVLTIRTGQTHVNRWSDDLLRRVEEGQIDPSFVITHTVKLKDGPEMYKTFRDKLDGCIKVVLKP